MKKRLILKNRAVTVFVSFITLIFLLSDNVRAKASVLEASDPAFLSFSSDAKFSGGTEELDVSSLEFPGDLGSVQKRFISPYPEKTVIHIQDAHSNYFCQKKISGILDHLNSVYGVSRVDLEGGSGFYDVSVFTDIDDDSLRKRVAEEFLREGLINGAEHYAIKFPGRVRLHGVDSLKLYLANLEAYRREASREEKTERYLRQLESALEELKMHIYSEELLELDRRIQRRSIEEDRLFIHVAWLFRKARSKGLTLSGFDNIAFLERVFKKEEKIDFEKAGFQRENLISRVNKMISREAAIVFSRKTENFSKKKISKRSYYKYLFEKARKMNLDIEEYSELRKYLSYVELFSKINESYIKTELRNLEESLKELYYENETQRNLDRLSTDLSLLRRLFAIAVSTKEYAYYRGNKDLFRTHRYVRFIKEKASDLRLSINLDRGIHELDTCREEISEFYEYAHKRDEAFLENISNSNLSVLVTGGFHTENLLSLFRKENISYASVMPNFTTSEDYVNPYHSLLSGQSAGLKQEIYPIISSVSAIQVASFLAGAFSDIVWGEEHVMAFEAAVAVRSEIAAGREVAGVKLEGENVVFSFSNGEKQRLSMKEFFELVDRDRTGDKAQRARELLEQLAAIRKEPAGRTISGLYQKKAEFVALGEYAVSACIDSVTKGDDPFERDLALEVIEELGGRRTMDLVYRALTENIDKESGFFLASSLASLGEGSYEYVKRLLQEHGLRENVLEAIRALGDESLIADIRKLNSGVKRTRALIFLRDEQELARMLGVLEEVTEEYIKDPTEEGRKKLEDQLAIFAEEDLQTHARSVLEENASLKEQLAQSLRKLTALIRDLSENNSHSQSGQVFDKRAILKAFEASMPGESNAEALWQFYEVARNDKNEAYQKRIAALLEKEGRFALSVLHQKHGDEDAWKILKRINHPSSVPYFLDELERAASGKPSPGIKQFLSSVVESMGKKALPYLFEELKNKDRKGYEDVCRFIYRIDPRYAAQEMAKVFEKGSSITPDAAKEVFVQLSRTVTTDFEIMGELDLRRELFEIAEGFLDKNVGKKVYSALENILRSTAEKEDIPLLIEVYGGVSVSGKKAILVTLRDLADERAIEFLIKTFCETPNDLESEEALKVLSDLAITGELGEYLAERPLIREKVITELRKMVPYKDAAVTILGYSDLDGSLGILTEELARMGRSGEVRYDNRKLDHLLEALMVDRRSLGELRSENPQILEDLNAVSEEVIMSGDRKRSETFIKWMLFTTEKSGAFPVIGIDASERSERLLEEYFTSRIKSADLAVEIRSFLLKNPEIDSSKSVMENLEKDLQELSSRNRALFWAGLLVYLREKKFLGVIEQRARRIGMLEKDWISYEDIKNDPEKEEFLLDLIGFLPEGGISVEFWEDTVDIMLDGNSFDRLLYRKEHGLKGGEEDEYSKLSPREKAYFDDNSQGIYFSYKNAVLGRQDISGGRAVFQRSDTSAVALQTLIHEIQHRFFEVYSGGDLKELLLQRIRNKRRCIKQINNGPAERQEKAAEELTEWVTDLILFHYQNEILAFISDGGWIDIYDIDEWFFWYKRMFTRTIQQELSGIKYRKIRTRIFNEAFEKARKIVKEKKPILDEIISTEAELWRREAGKNEQDSFKHAGLWLTHLLSSVPVKKFDRLHFFSSMQKKELAEVIIADLRDNEQKNAEDEMRAQKDIERLKELFGEMASREKEKILNKALENKYGFAEGLLPSNVTRQERRVFLAMAPDAWENWMMFFSRHLFSASQDAEVLVKSLENGRDKEEYVWRALEELSGEFPGKVISVIENSRTLGITRPDLVDAALNSTYTQERHINKVLRNLFACAGSDPDLLLNFAYRIRSALKERLDFRKRSDIFLVGDALEYIETGGRFKKSVTARVRGSDIETIGILNDIFQYVHGRVKAAFPGKARLSYETLLNEVSSREDFNKLDGRRKAAVKTFLARFFMRMHEIAEKFERDRTVYPIDEYNQASKELRSVNKSIQEYSKRKMYKERNRGKARRREILTELHYLRDRLKPYFTRNLGVPSEHIPLFGKIEAGPLSFEVHTDHASLQGIHFFEDDLQQERTVNNAHGKLKRPSIETLDVDLLKGNLMDYPKYLYKDFQEELTAFMTDDKFFHIIFGDMVETYSGICLDRLFDNLVEEIKKKYEYDEESLRNKKREIKNMLEEEIFVSPEWQALRKDLFEIREILHGLVEARAKNIFAERKKSGSSLEETELVRASYRDAQDNIMGLLHFTPLEKKERFKRELDRMNKKLSNVPDELLPPETSGKKEVFNMKKHVRDERVHFEEDHVSLGVSGGKAIFVTFGGSQKVLDHERQHMLFKLFQGDVIRSAKASADFDLSDVLRKATRKTERPEGFNIFRTFLEKDHLEKFTAEKSLEKTAEFRGISVFKIKSFFPKKPYEGVYADIDSGTVYIAEGIYSEDLAGREAFKLASWRNKALSLKSLEGPWEQLNPQERSGLMEELWSWMDLNADLAVELDQRYSSEAEIAYRKEVTAESLNAASRRRDTVRVVVGASAENMSLNANLARELGRFYASRGFGDIIDRRQVELFEIDIDRPEKLRKAVAKARKDLPENSLIVVFAPENQEMRFASDLAREEGSSTNILIIPDSYTDHRPSAGKFADINIRAALARHVSYYYRGNNEKHALLMINAILESSSDNAPVKSIEDLFEFSSPLRISPLEYQDIIDWAKAQKAALTSL